MANSSVAADAVDTDTNGMACGERLPIEMAAIVHRAQSMGIDPTRVLAALGMMRLLEDEDGRTGSAHRRVSKSQR